MFKWGNSVKKPDGTTTYSLITKFGFFVAALVSMVLTELYMVTSTLDIVEAFSTHIAMKFLLVFIAILLGLVFDFGKVFSVLHLAVNKVTIDKNGFPTWGKCAKLGQIGKAILLFIFSYRIIFVFVLLSTGAISLIATQAQCNLNSLKAVKSSEAYTRLQNQINAKQGNISFLKKDIQTARNEIESNNSQIRKSMEKYNNTRYKVNALRNEAGYRNANERKSREIQQYYQSIQRNNEQIAALQEQQAILEKGTEGAGNFLINGIRDTFSLLLGINLSGNAAVLWFAIVLELAVIGFGIAYVMSTSKRVRDWLVFKKEQDEVQDKFYATVATSTLLDKMKQLAEKIELGEAEIEKMLTTVNNVHDQFSTARYQLGQTSFPSLLQESSQKKNRLTIGQAIAQKGITIGRELTQQERRLLDEPLPDIYGDDDIIKAVLKNIKDKKDDENNGHDDKINIESQGINSTQKSEEILPRNSEQNSTYNLGKILPGNSSQNQGNNSTQKVEVENEELKKGKKVRWDNVAKRSSLIKRLALQENPILTLEQIGNEIPSSLGGKMTEDGIRKALKRMNIKSKGQLQNKR